MCSTISWLANAQPLTLGLVLLLAGKDIYCYNAAYVGLTLCDPSYADDFITELGASAKNVCDKRADRIGVFDWKARGGLRLCRAGVECISESDHDEKNGVTCPLAPTQCGLSQATAAPHVPAQRCPRHGKPWCVFPASGY